MAPVSRLHDRVPVRDVTPVVVDARFARVSFLHGGLGHEHSVPLVTQIVRAALDGADAAEPVQLTHVARRTAAAVNLQRPVRDELLHLQRTGRTGQNRSPVQW